MQTPTLIYFVSDHRLFVLSDSMSAIRSATPTLWEAAALGQVEQVARACLESSRSPKGTAGKPWACPGVNDKTPGLGFTPLHACMAGLAATTRGKDVCRPCTPPQPSGGRNNVATQLSLYARLARGCGMPRTRRRREKGEDAYVGVCRTLLSAGADIQALDARCRTPLALAAATGSSEVSPVTVGRCKTRIRPTTPKEFLHPHMYTRRLVFASLP